MAFTVPYAPRRLYDDTSARTLAELLGRRGEIAAQRWIDVGNTLGAMAQRRREAPLRAQQQQLAALQVEETTGALERARAIREVGRKTHGDRAAYARESR
jgi:hypothetical protein